MKLLNNAMASIEIHYNKQDTNEIKQSTICVMYGSHTHTNNNCHDYDTNTGLRVKISTEWYT